MKLQLIVACLLFLISCSRPKTKPTQLDSIDSSVQQVEVASRRNVEAHGEKWMVSTQGKFATQEAAKILRAGGSVIDAAIVASFVIGVERPQSTGIGGGGFLIYHEAKSGKNYVIDFRERAPLRATPKMFLDKKGEVVDQASVTGSLAVAVPGMVRGLSYLHSKFSHADWKRLVNPAENLATQGFPVYRTLAEALESEKEELGRFQESRATFLHSDGSPLRLGETLVQKNLGHTLRILASTPDDFYRGSIAKRIVATSKKYGGMLSSRDLATYPVKERKALEASWMGYHVISMPPPSSGGIHVIQILKMLEKDSLEKYGFLSAKSLNLESQAMQQAFADRAKYLGDPDFVKVPTQGLINEAYLANLRATFDEAHARTANSVNAGMPPTDDELNTSHITIMDKAGNVVVSTQTINGWFGSKVVAEGTGIVLNNEMDDFSAKVGASNIFEATSTSNKNQVEPKKTPLSSMSPTILLGTDGKPVLALGAPGGTRIITAVAQTILNYIVFHQDLYQAVAAVRIHEQWKPDTLFIENQSIPIETLNALRKMGWDIRRTPAQSDVMAIAVEDHHLVGVSDPRDIGTSEGE